MRLLVAVAFLLAACVPMDVSPNDAVIRVDPNREMIRATVPMEYVDTLRGSAMALGLVVLPEGGKLVVIGPAWTANVLAQDLCRAGAERVTVVSVEDIPLYMCMAEDYR